MEALNRETADAEAPVLANADAYLNLADQGKLAAALTGASHHSC